MYDAGVGGKSLGNMGILGWVQTGPCQVLEFSGCHQPLTL